MKDLLFKMLKFCVLGLFLYTSLLLFFQNDYGSGIFGLIISATIYYFGIHKAKTAREDNTDQHDSQHSEIAPTYMSEAIDAEEEHVNDTLPVVTSSDIKIPDIHVEPNELANRYDSVSIKRTKFFKYDKFNIPEPVFELLWFGDGKYKNTNIENEPSLIKKSVIRAGVAAPIGYYPSYESLNPAQKYKYLDWLTDISQPIDIGYVFIFYYGLERHVVEGKREKAVRMIRVLKSIFNNGSFQAYSNDALLLATMLDNNLRYLEGINLDTNPLQTLSVKYLTAGACDAIDIVNASNKIGFTNKRYIKSHPADFINTLNTLLIRQYGQDKYIFSIDNPSTLRANAAIIANYSLSLDVRFFGFIDVLQDSKTQQDLYNLLFITHEHIKELLKERRKKTNQKVKENLELPRIE